MASVDETPTSEATTHPITFLWTVPRSVSTSFERMMSARGDHQVFDEPYSRHYYYGPERRSDRYPDESLPDSSPDELLASIRRAAEERPVFVKDMAYQATPLLDPAILGDFRNSFLVRDPAATLSSLARHWPDFTDDEAGWDALDHAAGVVAEAGQEVVVLDAERLCDDPAGVVPLVRRDGPGLPRGRADLGARDARRLGAVGRLARLDRAVDRLRRAATTRRLPRPRDEPRLHEAYERALPVYERLAARAI